ncbi:TonB-dependent receptor [Flagellimonas meridianipacifica]|uniref:TonB-dependent receptor-like protein n=1 Tax=Flagellimonas meridianipacifica TaxID=1080225 RepID=A0A2T0MCJ7_9FLAO|nr:TonB-dependent receptor plug domain-containing protein [Allomuricauda pacifica]PRX55217.1 TonB-dependent receptor-like protein [Allomuricauda pacifica]
MNERLLVLVFLVLSLHSINIVAQTETNQPLTIILETLQERFGVQFNYASKLVDDVNIVAPDTSLDLQKSIAYLNSNINLSFVFVSDKIISVKRKKLRICGHLKDKDTGDVLPYVALQKGSEGIIADDQGYFEIDGLKEDDIIHIRHIGYKPLKREVRYFNTSECITLYLVPYQEKLAEVTVYDYLVRGIDKLDDGTVELDFDRFSILPGLVEDDVLFSIQALPGIQSIDETVSNINIRGGSHDQNLITWDGIKMYQSGHFFGLISMYNPHITQKVQLRKNGSSAAMTDGVSGTIAMETDEYLNTGLKGGIGINLIDANGSLDAPLGKKASLQVAARKSISDFVETPTYSQYFDRISQDTEIEQNTTAVTNSDIAFDFYDASFRLLYQPTEKDRFRINFIHTANEVIFNEVAQISGAEQARESNLEQTTIAAGINYRRNWNEKLRTQIEIYNTDYALKAKNANILLDQRFLQENKVSETGIRLKALNVLTPRMNWTSGYHFVETKVTNLDDVDDPRFLRLEGEVLRVHAIFTELGLSSKNSATQLTAGIRFNYLDDFKKQIWEPRLNFSHSFWEHFDLEVLGEFKHQSTSQVINFQNDFLGIEKRRWQLSNNESIPVITSKQGSVGLGFNKMGWLVNAVSFYKNVDGITTQSQGFQDRYEFVRTLGSYDAFGLDLLLRRQLGKNSIWLSYSFLDSEYFFAQLPETRFPSNFDITHALSIGTNYNIGGLLIAAGLNWRTGKPVTRPVSDNPIADGEINYADANNDRLNDYLRLDISGKYEFNWRENKTVQLGMAIWNVLDQDNTINSFYRPNMLGEAQEFQQSSLGITPNVSVRVIF